MTKRKVVTAAFLCIGLLSCSLTGIASAADQVEKKASTTVKGQLPSQLVKKLSELHDILPELKETQKVQSYYRASTFLHPFPTWEAVYRLPGRERMTSITFDEATGEIVEIGRDNLDWNSLELPSEQLAKETAEAFAKRIVGDKLQQYRMSEDVLIRESGFFDEHEEQFAKWVGAGVHFQRLANGIPLQNKGEIIVSVNSLGKVINYHAMPLSEQDLAHLPDPGKAISIDAAKKQLENQLEMRLTFAADKKPAVKYLPVTYNPIDAITGKPIVSAYTREDKTEILTVSGSGRKLRADSRKAAQDMLQTDFGIDVHGHAFQWGESINPAVPDQKVKGYFWSKDGYDVVLDADLQTGELTGLNVFDYNNSSANDTISEERARQNAINFLQKYLDPGIKEIKIALKRFPSVNDETVPEWIDKEKLADELRATNRSTAFQYQITALHHGIEIQNQTFEIGFNASGRISMFSRRAVGNQSNLPDKGSVIDPVAAKKAYVDNLSLQLVYLWPFYEPDGLSIRAKKPVLAYIPAIKTAYSYVDAQSGKVGEEPYPRMDYLPTGER